MKAEKTLCVPYIYISSEVLIYLRIYVGLSKFRTINYIAL